MSWQKLILIGDSNTQFGHDESGWVNSIANLFQRKCDVINRGFSGYNTDHLKIMIPKIMSEFTPESVCGVVIMLGTNDSTKSSCLVQHVPFDRYKTNMSYLVDFLLEWGVPKNRLIVVSPGRINDERWAQVLGPTASHHDHLVKDYSKAATQVALEKGVLNFDFYKSMEEYGQDYHQFLHDGLHLSKSGGDLLYNGLLPLLTENILNNLKLNFPDWKDLQPNQQEFNQ